jgi:AmiR/NasT family two-component response regulator
LDEDGAYQLLRTNAMSQNKRLIDVARILVSVEDLLG